jgi:hypothetical protein
MCPHFVFSIWSSLALVLLGGLWGWAGPFAGAIVPVILWRVLGVPAWLALPAAVGANGVLVAFDASGGSDGPGRNRDWKSVSVGAIAAGLASLVLARIPHEAVGWFLAAALSGIGLVRLAFRGSAWSGAGASGWLLRNSYSGAANGSLALPLGDPAGAFLAAAVATGVAWWSGEFRWNVAFPALVAMGVGTDLGRSLRRRIGPDRARRILDASLLVAGIVATATAIGAQ